MRIQDRKSGPVGPIAPVGSPAPAEVGKSPAPASPAEDRIDISDRSREVDGLRDAVQALPEVRLDKIEGIRGAVEEGSYYVESEKIAKRVVDEALNDAVRRDRRGNSTD
jgi:flagellar biosynthesis anti-sigma factor FlgM